jgi:hypothetical protein
MKEKFGFEGVNRRSEVRERLERNVLEREKNFQKTVTVHGIYIQILKSDFFFL